MSKVHEVARVKGKFSSFIVLLDPWWRGRNTYWVRRIDRSDGAVLEHRRFPNLPTALIDCAREVEMEWRVKS